MTVFSAPNYCGEFNNAAGMMCVREDLVCSFKLLRPITHKCYKWDLVNEQAFTMYDPSYEDVSS